MDRIRKNNALIIYEGKLRQILSNVKFLSISLTRKSFAVSFTFRPKKIFCDSDYLYSMCFIILLSCLHIILILCAILYLFPVYCQHFIYIMWCLCNVVD